MEAVKNLLAVLAGIIGVGTAFLTLYAKYLDVKKNAARGADLPADATTTAAARPEPSVKIVRMDSAQERLVEAVAPSPSAASVERARQAVRAPAITLIVAGLFSLVCNLFIAGFGCVDQFVTPLTAETQTKQAFQKAAEAANPGIPTPSYEDPDKANVVLTVFTLMGLSMASAAAAWAGYGMLNLRSYKLSIAGSFAIMAGGAFCCMGGIPIGIWSLVVLYKPEVVSSFR